LKEKLFRKDKRTGAEYRMRNPKVFIISGPGGQVKLPLLSNCCAGKK